MADYKIGQMLTVSKDIELGGFWGEKKLVKKGAKIWIGADKLAHHRDGSIQPLAVDSTVEGYDDKGITERIFAQLVTEFPLQEFCEENEIDSEEIKTSIEWALNELGI